MILIKRNWQKRKSNIILECPHCRILLVNQSAQWFISRWIGNGYLIIIFPLIQVQLSHHNSRFPPNSSFHPKQEIYVIFRASHLSMFFNFKWNWKILKLECWNHCHLWYINMVWMTINARLKTPIWFLLVDLHSKNTILLEKQMYADRFK